MRVVIPGQPKAQKRHRTGKGGHRYNPSKKDKGSIRRSLMQIKPSKPISGPVRIEINAFFQTPQSWSNKKIKEHEGKYRPKKPDTDNIEKILFDSMNGFIFEDDNQIVESVTRKFYSAKPATEIIIKQLDQ